MKISDGQELAQRTNKVRRVWAKRAPQYDKSIGFFERRVFGRSHRGWACSRATGDVLEVAVGTGLNLPHYPTGARLTGLDLSNEMLAIARERSQELGREIELRDGDAHQLPFADESFDSVVCTYSLCNIPDPQRALAEMRRILRPGGKVILVDHIRSASKPVFWIQRAVEFITRRLEGEHMTRRPAEYLEPSGFDVIERERLGSTGVVERAVAVKGEGNERK